MIAWTKEMIIYEDEDILVTYKPANFPVQTKSSGLMDLESSLKIHLASGLKGRQMPYLGIIQRLDQPVEGILLFAKNQKAASLLNAMMQKGEIKKAYLAIVEGKVRAKEEVLEDYLVKDAKINMSKVTCKSMVNAKLARLHYRYLEDKIIEERVLSLVEVKLFTGRHHQIRVQLSNAGMPLYGDYKYGEGDKDKVNQEGTIALCAAKLSFSHPKTKKIMEFSIKPKNPIFDFFEKTLP